jgi:pyroglutamyl-peptidase
MRLLLTAFEPFDGSGLNSSLAGCRRFLEQDLGALEVRFAVLPVRYGPDVEAVDAALAEYHPEVVLHTGQATGAAVVRVERRAVNVRYGGNELSLGRATADHPEELIAPNGPAALFSTLDVERVAAAIRAAGVPAVVSNHAGIYLCNHALYQSLWRAERARTGVRVGFLHLPALPEQVTGEVSMPAEQLAAAIDAAVRSIAGG